MANQQNKPQPQPQTRFHRLVRREGGMTRDEAIRRADAFIETAKSKYHNWVADDITLLDQALTVLKGCVTPDPEGLDRAYHKSRNIRDLGATMGYPVVTAIADSLCELLNRFKAHSLYSQPAIDTHYSALLLVSASEYGADNKAVTQNLLPGLERVVKLFPPVKTADRRQTH